MNIIFHSELAMQKAVEWHSGTNHKYDNYLPYEYHLRMVVSVAIRFRDVFINSPDLKSAIKASSEINISRYKVEEIFFDYVICACWLHDTIEDCRITYNDLKEHFPTNVCDIVYALSNEKGKNRDERANIKYYLGIRETPLAQFVKLCDRIANVEYSRMTRGRMLKKYEKENPHFKEHLYKEDLKEMFDYLESLFINK